MELHREKQESDMRIEGISAHQLPHSQKSLIHPRFVRVPGQSSNVGLQQH